MLSCTDDQEALKIFNCREKAFYSYYSVFSYVCLQSICCCTDMKAYKLVAGLMTANS